MEGLTLSPRAIEAAAFAVAECRRVITGSTTGTLLPSDHMFAEAALAGALAVDGLCLVPKEPTDKMREAGARMSTSCCAANGCIVGDVYRAMLAAASTGDSPRQREEK